MKKHCRVWVSVLTLCFIFMGATVAPAKELTDQLGRRVNVPDDPKRVVSLAPSITEIIYAIHEEDKLVGVTRFSDYPPPARNLPKVGTYIHLDLERIIALRPDFCIAVKDGNPKAIVDRIESFGIPTYAVDPRNLNAVMATVEEIGGLLGAEERARAVVHDMNRRIDRIKSLTKHLEHPPTVFFQIGITPIVSVGTDTFIHELITSAGGVNLARGEIPYPRYTKEQVISLAPEIFIITSMAREAVFDRVKQEWEEWPNIPAVKNHRIHLVNSDLFDRAAPRLVDGLEVLFRLFHPKLAERLQ